MMQTHNAVPVSLAVVLAAGVFTGCAATPAPGGEEPAAGGDDKKVPITIAVPPSSFAASLYAGVEEGIFADEGFEVTLEPSTSMAETMPLLLSGEYDYIYADVHNTLIAASENVPVVMTAPITTSADEDSDEMGFGNIFAAKGSGISDVHDLAGITIGTNSINGQAMLDAIEVLGRQGVETDGIEWVAIPGPQLATALAQGQVDAVTLGEPYGTAMLAEGGVEFIVSLDGGLLSTPMAGLTTLRETVSADPETAARLRDAMIAANQAVIDDPQLAYDAMAGFMPMPPEILEQSVLPLWATEPFTGDAAQPVLDRLVELDLLSKDRAPDLAAVFPEL